MVSLTFLTVEIIWNDAVLCFNVPQENVPSFLEQIFQLQDMIIFLMSLVGNYRQISNLFYEKTV